MERELECSSGGVKGGDRIMLSQSGKALSNRRAMNGFLMLICWAPVHALGIASAG